jgi:hypothetical protein
MSFFESEQIDLCHISDYFYVCLYFIFLTSTSIRVMISYLKFIQFYQNHLIKDPIAQSQNFIFIIVKTSIYYCWQARHLFIFIFVQLSYFISWVSFRDIYFVCFALFLLIIYEYLFISVNIKIVIIVILFMRYVGVLNLKERFDFSIVLFLRWVLWHLFLL